MKNNAKQVVENMFGVFAQGDIDAIVNTFSENAILIHHGTQIMPSAKFDGREGARMFFEMIVRK